MDDGTGTAHGTIYLDAATVPTWALAFVIVESDDGKQWRFIGSPNRIPVYTNREQAAKRAAEEQQKNPQLKIEMHHIGAQVMLAIADLAQVAVKSVPPKTEGA